MGLAGRLPTGVADDFIGMRLMQPKPRQSAGLFPQPPEACPNLSRPA